MESIFDEVMSRTSLICVVTVHRTYETQAIELLNSCVFTRKMPITRSRIEDYVILSATIKKNRKEMLDNAFNMLMGACVPGEKLKMACMGIKFETINEMKGEKE